MNTFYYDPKPLKDLSVAPFLLATVERDRHIAAAADDIPNADNNSNALAKRLHPEFQRVRVAAVGEHGGVRSFRLTADIGRGTARLAYFRAGQYVCTILDVNGAKIRLPLHICSSPKKALGADGYYVVTVAPGAPGSADNYIFENWKQGSEAVVSGPVGELYYERLRDAENVVALASGMSDAPFCSMAEAIADGTEEFSLTIFRDEAVVSERLEMAVEASKGRVRIYPSPKERVSAAAIKKAAGTDDFSLFLCGDREFYKLEKPEISMLGLPKRRVRKEVPGDYTSPEKNSDYPREAIGKAFRLSVKVDDTIHLTECRADETLMQAVEKAGIGLNSHCRSGECGWCRSKLISGEVYVPKDADGRREADRMYGWIHPCATFPLSDIEVEVYPPVN